MPSQQLSLFSPGSVRPFNYPFPSTRYQGSKRTLVDWIWENVWHLSFDTVLDVFGGTGAVSHMFKNAGKQVIYNDLLTFNWHIGQALIENRQVTLSPGDIDRVLTAQEGVDYPTFIQKTFEGIYFTSEENAGLDRVVHNIQALFSDQYKQALALFALFQACLIKRPYNLFHRANLYMRTAHVERSFGNETTWNTPFERHFRNFAAEANRAIFDNGQTNHALHVDAAETPTGADLVYIDPPYLNRKGIGVDYRDFYHFLEGLVHYDSWRTHIDYRSKHRRLQPQESPWNQAGEIIKAFEQLIERHRKSILVISYRDDGIPSKDDLIRLLSRYKKQVTASSQPKQYALAHAKAHELVLIGL
ncbi:MAG TPA: DNA adenine methylase [Aggregatilineales bacterium]|nr:DNA adenine methylase [Anaerolineales bacterium]HRE46920.1 DNA adenine methylase [Aggregatilineales bacterium]